MRLRALLATFLLFAGLAATSPAAGAAPRGAAAAAAPVALPAKVTAGRDGVVAVRVRNRRRQALTVTVAVRAEGVTARKRLRIGARRAVVARLRLRGAARRKLAAGERLRLRLSATARAGDGRPRTVSRALTVAAPARPGGGGGGAGEPPVPAAPPFDGTYEEPNGWTMVVEGGVVLTFSGTITTYCTGTARQKSVYFSMAADDPSPTVAPDGSFAWEATAGYGFVKLKYQGRIADGRATGNAVVEDRSPKLGSDRFEFDYCFAGRDFALERRPAG